MQMSIFFGTFEIHHAHLNRHSVHWVVQIVFKIIILLKFQQQISCVDVENPFVLIEFKFDSPSVRSKCSGCSECSDKLKRCNRTECSCFNIQNLSVHSHPFSL